MKNFSVLHPCSWGLGMWLLALCLVFFTHSAGYAAQVSLAWNPNPTPPDGYHVFQRTADCAYDYNMPVWSGAGTQCTLTGLLDNTTYYFVARAYVGANHSGDSNEVVYTTPVTEFTLTATAGSGGSITPSGNITVSSGGSQVYKIAAQSGYEISDVKVDGVSKGAISSFTFSSVAANHTIAVSFIVKKYTITASANTGGSISPAGTTTVSSGDSQVYRIAPAAGYLIADVRVDGVSKGAISSFAFSSVTANHSIAASFVPKSYTITSTASRGGSITPSGSTTVSSGGSQAYQIAADDGYKIDNVIVDGKSLGVINNYTFISLTGNHTISASFVQENQPPIADAGPDQNVEEAQIVTLNGANSIDNDDGIVSYKWRQIAGSEVELDDYTSEQPTFLAPDVGVEGMALVFELTVTDKSGELSKDTCIVNVLWVNQAPVANAGGNQNVNSGDKVTLDGTRSTDPDDGIVSYKWVQVNGPAVVLAEPNSAKSTFTAPRTGVHGASLTFELTVTDAGGLQATDQSIVTVVFNNAPPVAHAGRDQQCDGGDEIILDGSLSSDADDGIATYVWKQTKGKPVVLTDPGAIRPSFVAPEVGEEGDTLSFQLTVTDNHGLQGTDSCEVVVRPVVPKIVDIVPPAIRVTSPAISPWISLSRMVTIGGLASDNNQVTRVTWKDSTGRTGLADGTKNWKIRNLNLTSRLTTITVTAHDAAGNTRSTNVVLYLLW